MAMLEPRMLPLLLLVAVPLGVVGAGGRPSAVVTCETHSPQHGDASFGMELHRDWAPLGYDRFMALLDAKFFNDMVARP
jgi:hypothetical protein